MADTPAGVIGNGDMIRLHGRQGKFRFLYADGESLTFWGPITKSGSNQAQFTSVKVDQIKDRL